MTFDELLAKLLEVCPRGSMGEDNDGQLVFYTDLRSGEGETVEAFEPKDADADSENPGVST
jgi:hypothetical protein